MAKIVLRYLGVLILVVNLVIIILSYITNVNIYEKYGTQILKFFGLFVLLVLAFYIALAILGVS